MRACMRSSSPKRTAALPRDRLRIGCRQHPCVSGQDRSLCLDPLSATPHIVMPGLVPGISLGAVSAAEMDARNKSGHDGYRIRTSAPGVVALHCPNRRPGLRAGAQPRSSRQPRTGVLPDSHISARWRGVALPQPSPRPPSRGPASVLTAAPTVRPALHRLRRQRKTGMGPRLRGDDEKGAKARAARTAGTPHTSRNEMCACGRTGVRGRPRQSDQPSTGCGGIGSQGWVPAFAGTTKRGQRPAQPGCRAHRMHDHARCMHAVGHDGRGALGHNGAGPCIGATLKRSPDNAG